MEKELSHSNTSLRVQAFAMIGILVAEYVLGVATSLFVEFPERGQEGQLWVFASRQLPLALHMVAGILLFFGSIAFFLLAVKRKNRKWIIASGVAAVAIFGGDGAGSAFIPNQSEWYSFIMSISLMIALLSYFWGVINDKTVHQQVH